MGAANVLPIWEYYAVMTFPSATWERGTRQGLDRETVADFLGDAGGLGGRGIDGNPESARLGQ
jgi:hypothetical protein